ncbi:MAG: hypothetical protein Q9173_004449 [Seirophora scorigena]
MASGLVAPWWHARACKSAAAIATEILQPPMVGLIQGPGQSSPLPTPSSSKTTYTHRQESHALTRSVVGAPDPQSFATGFPSRHISPPRTMRRSAKTRPWTAASVYLLTSSHPQESAKHRRQFLQRRKNDYTRALGGSDDLYIAASTTSKPGGLTSDSCLHVQSSSSQNKNVSKPRLLRSARTIDTPQTELGFEQCLPPLMQPNIYRGHTRALGLRLAPNPSTNFEEI